MSHAYFIALSGQQSNALANWVLIAVNTSKYNICTYINTHIHTCMYLHSHTSTCTFYTLAYDRPPFKYSICTSSHIHTMILRKLWRRFSRWIHWLFIIGYRCWRSLIKHINIIHYFIHKVVRWKGFDDDSFALVWLEYLL